MEDDDFNNEGENSDNSNRVESDIDEPVDMQQIENRIVQDVIVILQMKISYLIMKSIQI